jgi:pimeloyl-ACP methyl ester carboxylesterase
MRRAWPVLLIAMVVACSSSSGSIAHTPTPKPSPTVASGTLGGAAYRIEVPSSWNGTLFLYSHGYVAPGRPNPATDAPLSLISDWLLDQGFALAGSAYSSTGWALEDAFKDQIALLDEFGRRFSKPARVIAWGGSLGGIITAGLVQLHPDRFAGAIPLCGVLAGGVATWNTGLDAAYAFKTLLAPASRLRLTGIIDPAGNLQLATAIFNDAVATARGKARLALVAALSGLPGWFDPTTREPAPTDFDAWAAAQAQWESRVDFPFEFSYRQELERRAGGNPSWNVGVDYQHQLSISPYAIEVAALYRAAGLDLAADLRRLNAGPRIKAEPRAVAYLDRNISFDGRLVVPVLTMHTTGDGLVIPQDETAYADVVGAEGKQDMLRQVYVHRAGHCAFTAAETIAVVQTMLGRLDTGRWDDAALEPAALAARARAQGEPYDTVGGFFTTSPAFVAFAPGPYPRPFPKGATAP